MNRFQSFSRKVLSQTADISSNVGVNLIDEFLEKLQSDVNRNFKPFSEFMDCRRYGFVMKTGIFQRVIKNFEYFSFNYLAISFSMSVGYLVYNQLLSFGFLISIALWVFAYIKRQVIFAISATELCYNIKMTIFLLVNFTLLYILYDHQIFECIGFIMSPIISHSILFEPVLQQPEQSVEANKNIGMPNENIDEENQKDFSSKISQSSASYLNESIQNQTAALSISAPLTVMNDEMQQAYNHAIEAIVQSTKNHTPDSEL